jgi:hypothetical protein
MPSRSKPKSATMTGFIKCVLGNSDFVYVGFSYSVVLLNNQSIEIACLIRFFEVSSEMPLY